MDFGIIFISSQELKRIPDKIIAQAKINVRFQSRELIKVVFHVTENFPKNDPDEFAPVLRKKVLGISSFLTHGTVKTDKEERNEDFLAVMGELREVLKVITIAHQLKYCADREIKVVRIAIAKFIDALDKLVILLGGFEKK